MHTESWGTRGGGRWKGEDGEGEEWGGGEEKGEEKGGDGEEWEEGDKGIRMSDASHRWQTAMQLCIASLGSWNVDY